MQFTVSMKKFSEGVIRLHKLAGFKIGDRGDCWYPEGKPTLKLKSYIADGRKMISISVGEAEVIVYPLSLNGREFIPGEGVFEYRRFLSMATGYIDRTLCGCGAKSGEFTINDHNALCIVGQINNGSWTDKVSLAQMPAFNPTP